jgi:hypothetical protein
MSFMYKENLKRREYVWVHSIAKSRLIDHSARMYVNFSISLFNSIISHSEMIELNRSAMRGKQGKLC